MLKLHSTGIYLSSQLLNLWWVRNWYPLTRLVWHHSHSLYSPQFPSTHLSTSPGWDDEHLGGQYFNCPHPMDLQLVMQATTSRRCFKSCQKNYQERLRNFTQCLTVNLEMRLNNFVERTNIMNNDLPLLGQKGVNQCVLPILTYTAETWCLPNPLKRKKVIGNKNAWTNMSETSIMF